MVRKIFWEDAYVREFDAVVQDVSENRVSLDATAFNPRGGGLPGDTGTLNGARVVDTVKDGDSIVHVLDGPAQLTAGTAVHGTLDWDRRYRIMRMHTAAHALSAVFNREAGALITGNKIEPDESRIDFSIGELDRDVMTSYVDEVNREISRNPGVSTYFLPKEEALKIPAVVKLAGASPPDVSTFRIVEIKGLDTQADGGVHVGTLGEVRGIVPVKFENKGKSNRRLYFRLND
ncbi:MAG: alanyl-tRNA editing protein [Thermoplasmata archaeon]|nr:alanyl-tRNA editing protein [Candidatus Sysuiplasma acidicola]MBX8645943.1 alanyl-tRNA editing protein [Candidatus Sysuiplasma acidicola]MDH2905903.1 alanyl-tRNA editing protein [Methanomassiliicoccales archaeon]